MSHREQTSWAPTLRGGARFCGLLVVCGLVAALGAATARPALTPALFQQLASGVVPIRGADCAGRTRVEGSGFLVARGVVMTARHVVDPGGLESGDVCRLEARVDGEWIAIAHVDWWTRPGTPSGRPPDVATAVLAHAAPRGAHVFDFRKSSPAVGTQLAMLGYPLGQELSLTQGRLLEKASVQDVPTLTVRLLGAQGASGAPIVDDGGHVVALLQLGLGGSDVLGQQTAGVVQGLDLASWWGGWKIRPSLCRAYPQSGVPGCAPPPASTAASPAGPVAGGPLVNAAVRPAQPYHVRRCWLQETGDSWRAVDAADAISAVARAQVVAHPRAYWGMVSLGSTAPASLVVGAELVNPQGLASGQEAFTLRPGQTIGAATLDWAATIGHALVFADPWLGTRGRWQLRFSLPNDETCGIAFTVR